MSRNILERCLATTIAKRKKIARLERPMWCRGVSLGEESEREREGEDPTINDGSKGGPVTSHEPRAFAGGGKLTAWQFTVTAVTAHEDIWDGLDSLRHMNMEDVLFEIQSQIRVRFRLRPVPSSHCFHLPWQGKVQFGLT